MLQAVSSFGKMLEMVETSELRNDREIALKAVSSYGFALQWISSELQDDEEIVSAAVRICPGSLTFASSRLKSMLLFYAQSFSFDQHKR